MRWATHIIIGAVVIWRNEDPTRAVFCVEDYNPPSFIQTDSTIRTYRAALSL